MSGRRGSRLRGLVTVVLSLVVVAVGGALLALALRGPSDQAPAGPAPKGFADYSWDELAEVADMVAAAPSDEEAHAVAARYDVAPGASRRARLDDGTVVDVVVAGLRHDELADGSGVAGLTLLLSPVATRPMNASATSEGGWESSGLRAWLASDGMALLPDDLAAVVRPALKSSNDQGTTRGFEGIAQTADALWAPSVAEVCGDVAWFQDEYGSEPNAYTNYVDFRPYDRLLSSEGSQYELFSAAGVDGASSGASALVRSLRGADVAWWYRTPFPYVFDGGDDGYFYQVSPTGFPAAVGSAEQPAGVVVGLCL